MGDFKFAKDFRIGALGPGFTTDQGIFIPQPALPDVPLIDAPPGLYIPYASADDATAAPVPYNPPASTAMRVIGGGLLLLVLFALLRKG